VAVLEINTTQGKLTILNIYNPRSRDPRLQEWPQIQRALEETSEEILLLGDFNAHHPTWRGRKIACEQNAEHLLEEMERRELALITPEGEVTWRRGPQKSVIDLVFALQAICERTAFCGPEERWALPQDHIPIRISLNIQEAADKQANRRRYALQKLDREGLVKALRKVSWQQAPDPLQSLQDTLEDLLPRYCPKAKPCLRARPDWSPRASELLTGARHARRRYNASHRQEDLHDFKKLSNQLKHEIRRTSRAS
jgi:hypothetical protein